jgi:outer membrane biosynthesis protein TonB
MSIKKSYVSAKGIYKVTFSLPVAALQGNKSVALLGDFNNWEPSKGIALKSGKTEFSVSVDLAPGTYEFKYLIDNNIWENDFNADNYSPSPFAGVNNSVLVLPQVATKTTAKKEVAAKVTKTKVVAEKVAAKPVAKTEKKVAKAAVAPVKKATEVKVEKPAAKTEKKVATPKAAPAPKAVKSAEKPAAKKAVKPAKK